MMKIEKEYTAREAALLAPGLLAYIGDSVFELMVREYSLVKGVRRLHDLHQNTISIVNARAQASFLKLIEDSLTEVELDIVRRGRNSKSGQIPRKAEVMEYRLSTGFEALFGYLYLSKQEERLSELWRKILSFLDK